MSSTLYVTGLWRTVDAIAGGDNPGYQFIGLAIPDAQGRGYELTASTLDLVARSVEWMIDPATIQPYSYAQASIANVLKVLQAEAGPPRTSRQARAKKTASSRPSASIITKALLTTWMSDPDLPSLSVERC